MNNFPSGGYGKRTTSFQPVVSYETEREGDRDRETEKERKRQKRKKKEKKKKKKKRKPPHHTHRDPFNTFNSKNSKSLVIRCGPLVGRL